MAGHRQRQQPRQPERRPEKPKPHSTWDRLEDYLKEFRGQFAEVLDVFRDILNAIKSRDVPHGSGHTVIHVVSAKPTQKEIPMPPVDHMPDFTLPASNIDVGLQVVNPRLANGKRFAGVSQWITSDENALPLEAMPDDTVKIADPNWVDPDPAAVPPNTAPLIDALDPDDGLPLTIYQVRGKTVLTPEAGTTAEGVITWKGAGIVDVDIKVVYGDPALGHAAITARQIPDEA